MSWMKQIGSAQNVSSGPVQTGHEQFLSLLPVLQRTKEEESGCGIFAFTSATPGEGVTYVTLSLGRELALHPGERVLVGTPGSLASLVPADLKDVQHPVEETAPNLFVGPTKTAGRSAPPVFTPDLLRALRLNFTYVLLDCRSLRTSPEILRFVSQVDGLLLVVSAGQARRDQVNRAQKVLQLASQKLIGCVLNKRTYPIPEILHRHL